MTRAKRTVYKMILQSLRDHPEEWRFGTHEATKGNMTVWMANRYYGTKFSMGSIHSGNDGNPFWWLFPCEWWRVRLIHAVETAQLTQIEN